MTTCCHSPTKYACAFLVDLDRQMIHFRQHHINTRRFVVHSCDNCNAAVCLVVIIHHYNIYIFHSLNKEK